MLWPLSAYPLPTCIAASDGFQCLSTVAADCPIRSCINTALYQLHPPKARHTGQSRGGLQLATASYPLYQPIYQSHAKSCLQVYGDDGILRVSHYPHDVLVTQYQHLEHKNNEVGQELCYLFSPEARRITQPESIWSMGVASSYQVTADMLECAGFRVYGG